MTDLLGYPTKQKDDSMSAAEFNGIATAIDDSLQRKTFVTVGRDSTSDYNCDGTADDVQIQAAIDSLSSTGGIVFIKKGTYDIAATITLTDNISICGEGTATILKAKTALNNEILQADGTATPISGITISDIKIDGNKTNQSGNDDGNIGIKLLSCSNCLINDVTIINTRNHGIYVGEGSNKIIVQNNNVSGAGIDGTSVGTGIACANLAYDIVIKGNIIVDAEYCVSVFRQSSGTATNKIIITNNHLQEAWGGAALRCYTESPDTNAPNEIIISDNLFYNNSSSYVVSCNNQGGYSTQCINITNNIFTNNNPDVGGNISISGKYINIQNNIIKDTTTAKTDIELGTTAEHCSIMNNILLNAGSHSISLNGVNDVRVSNNRILNPTGYGINVYNSSLDVIISDNDIKDEQGTKTMTRGIYVSAGTNINVLSNYIVGAINYGILMDGTDYFLLNANIIRLCGSGGADSGLRIANVLNSTVSNNMITDNNGYGLRITGTSTNVIINGNNCCDVGVNTQTYGIVAENTPTYFLVVNNQCQGNVTAEVSIAAITGDGNSSVANNLGF